MGYIYVKEYKRVKNFIVTHFFKKKNFNQKISRTCTNMIC